MIFHTNTALAQGLRALFQQLEERLSLSRPVHVLLPVDLAVSKIARFADNDKEDIAALVSMGLTTADAIEQRAIDALTGFVGGLAMLQLNLRDAVVLARKVQAGLSSARV